MKHFSPCKFRPNTWVHIIHQCVLYLAKYGMFPCWLSCHSMAVVVTAWPALLLACIHPPPSHMQSEQELGGAQLCTCQLFLSEQDLPSFLWHSHSQCRFPKGEVGFYFWPKGKVLLWPLILAHSVCRTSGAESPWGTHNRWRSLWRPIWAFLSLPRWGQRLVESVLSSGSSNHWFIHSFFKCLWPMQSSVWTDSVHSCEKAGQ